MKIKLTAERKSTLRYLARLSGYILLVLNFFGWALVLTPEHTVRKKNQSPIKFKVVNKKVKIPRPTNGQTPNRILLEPNLQKTKPPQKADVLGLQDRTAKKRQRVRPENSTRNKANSNINQKSPNKKEKAKKEKPKKQGSNQKQPKDQTSSSNPPSKRRSSSFSKFGRKVAKPYERLLMGSDSIAKQEILKGYQQAPSQYIDDSSLPFGISTDVNVKEYRLAGYFVHIEQAVQQAFFAPNTKRVMEASKSSRPILSEYAQALVIIDSSGNLKTIEIVNSSGNPILNNHWITVLKAAAPFPPLPTKSGLNELKFAYKLNFGSQAF